MHGPGHRALLAWLATVGGELAHPVVVCDHVTLAYPDTPAPAPVQVVVVGVAANARIQALVVEVDGLSLRLDGETYHVTLSRVTCAEDYESKAMLRHADVRPLPALTVPTSPFLRRAHDADAWTS